ncbi:hypothetical protein RUM44_000565 [Polyplax serrata]|uniref:CCA tRNA nucleotidyltransferase 1, mitochondrial n=1 Tax=Polyplax serrata TaxID=468196 RepID=A0ABR1B5U8_POLSC
MSFRSGIVYGSLVFKTIAKRGQSSPNVPIKNWSRINIWHCRKYGSAALDKELHLPLKEPIIMKISDSPEFHACLTNEVAILKNLFHQNGHELRIVGGAVRDLLLGIKPVDLDFATTATPSDMKELFTANEIRLINSNGEKHGTITARIGERNFEVTTLRVDIVTDGRHATVEFTKNWLLDANRRDLTINSMYLDFQGNLYDYFNGYEDLKARTIRFVGDAVKRIQEDYLRILRYFRFYGKIAREPDNHIESTLAAIKENSKGLANISGERIWVELNKICTGNYACEILEKIVSLNVGKYIGFPDPCNLDELKTVSSHLKKNGVPYKPMTLLSALFNTEQELEVFYKRIKPSTLEKTLGIFILANRNKKWNEKPLRALQRCVINSQNVSHTISHVHEFLKYSDQIELLKEFENWKVPKLPIDGNQLRKSGIDGRKIGLVLNKLKDIWIDNDFNIDQEELLQRVPDVVANLSPTVNTKKMRV